MATYLKLRSDIEVEVRYLLSDPTDYPTITDGSDAHWDLATLIFWLNKGIMAIRRMRPESKLCGRDELTYYAFTVAQHTADSCTILADTYNEMIVNFICWKMLSQDSVDEYASVRANEFKSQFFALKGGNS